jgi:23S rRNA A2030 N6-methylase RlmJ
METLYRSLLKSEKGIYASWHYCVKKLNESDNMISHLVKTKVPRILMKMRNAKSVMPIRSRGKNSGERISCPVPL